MSKGPSEVTTRRETPLLSDIFASIQHEEAEAPHVQPNRVYSLVDFNFVQRTIKTVSEIRQYVDVSPNAVLNMFKLIDGNRNWPWILLQNPTFHHDYANHEEMVKDTFTLNWLEKRLRMIGLSLQEVTVLDIFPLLTDNDLKELDSEQKSVATALTFSITADLIRTYKPSSIISMQCHSKQEGNYSYKSLRGNFSNADAHELGSKVAWADDRSLCTSTICGHSVQLVFSRHPSGIGRGHARDFSLRNTTARQDFVSRDMKMYMEAVDAIFESEYGPCIIQEISDEIDRLRKKFACLNFEALRPASERTKVKTEAVNTEKDVPRGRATYNLRSSKSQTSTKRDGDGNGDSRARGTSPVQHHTASGEMLELQTAMAELSYYPLSNPKLIKGAVDTSDSKVVTANPSVVKTKEITGSGDAEEKNTTHSIDLVGAISKLRIKTDASPPRVLVKG